MGLNWGAHIVKQPARVQETYDGLFELYAAGKIRPVVSARYSLDDVPKALAALGSRATYGKLVIEP